MARTFTWRVPRVDSTPLVDGLALIYNDTDPGELEIIEIRITEPSETATSLVGSGSQDLVRVSAVNGGDPVVALRMDPSSSALPSQVVFSTAGLSVTEGDLLRRLPDCPQLAVATGAAMMAARSIGRPSARQDVSMMDQVWNSWSTPSGSEGLILSAGEGLALMQRSGVVPHAMTVNIRLRNTASGETYVYRSRDIGTMLPDRPIWALMNGTGSGVTLEVLSIQLTEDGDVSTGVGVGLVTPTMLRLLRCDGMINSQEFVPTVGIATGMDPVAVFPPGIQLRYGAFRTNLVGRDYGVQYTWDTTDHSVAAVTRDQRSGILRQLVRCPRPNRIGGACATPDQGFDVFKAKVGSGIVLRRGEGLAVAGGRAGVFDNSQFNFFDLRITMVHRAANIFPSIGNGRIVRPA